MRTLALYSTICVMELLNCFVGLSQVDVLTQHNDLARTGWNNQETTLNHSNVNSSTFGQVFALNVDEQVYAQPLVVTGVNIPSVGVKNVVYVCTVNNSVYAFDADNGMLYWHVSFIPSGYRSANAGDMHTSLCDGGYWDFGNNIGIAGTPVIDKVANTIYFVTKIASKTGIDNHSYVHGAPDDEYNYSSAGFFQYLHAVDLRTGGEKANSPALITAQANGTGDGNISGTIAFDPRRQFNRAGLVLSRGIVYIAFASHCDWNPSHGWLLGYDAVTLAPKIVYNTTPNDGRGGIWMCGAAPAVDGSGSLYFTTGNSNDGGTTSYPPDYPGGNVFADLAGNGVNLGESVVKVTPNQPDNTATGVSVSSFFTPLDYDLKNEIDEDFPIQIMLLPGTHMLVTGCKDDSLYVMDTTNLGGYSTTHNSVLQTVFVNPSTPGDMHSSLAYFSGSNASYIYQLGENTNLQAFPVGVNSLGTAITNATPNTWPIGNGGFMSTSSNGSDTSTAILWINQAASGCPYTPCPGILRAIRANNIKSELWNSTDKALDNLKNFGKMSCPTIANGKVYQANGSNQVVVYSLLTNPLPLDLLSFTANNIDNQYVQLKWSTSGAIAFDHFDLERATDAIAFAKFTQVKGEPGSSIEQFYATTDNNPADGKNYYRIKEVDLNGNAFYSPVVSVNFVGGISTPRISPNPANTFFTIQAGSETIQEVNLLDGSGKKILHLLNPDELATVNIQTDKIAAGVYIVEIKTLTHIYHEKLLRQ